MIEVTIKQIEGVRFINDIHILEPDETIGGLGVHRIDSRILETNAEFMRAIKAMGLKKVGLSEE